MKLLFFLMLTVVLVGCTRPGDHPISDNCQWLEDDHRTLNLQLPADRSHLRKDVETAEDVAIRWADKNFGLRREYQPKRDQCMSQLFGGLASQHDVGIGTIDEYLGRRDIFVDVAVILSFATFYAVAAYLLVGKIRKRFAPAAPGFWVMSVTMALGVGLVSVMLGGLWSIVVEGIRLNSGHLSYRMNRIPARQYWSQFYLCSIAIFGVAVLIRSRMRFVPGRIKTPVSLFPLIFVICTTYSLADGQNGSLKNLTRKQTLEAEARLTELGYWPGKVDGVIDESTKSAVITFQKWTGRSVNGQLTLDELEAIRGGVLAKPRDEGYSHVEVDLDRQVLLLIDVKQGVRLLPVSTGSGKSFADENQTSVAYTPRGRFIVYNKVSGWERGPLGSLFYSNYISGGVAIHGARDVPNTPESHGCIRIPLFAAREVSKLMPLGTIVLVYDKISFVSARAWVERPKLKPTADIE